MFNCFFFSSIIGGSSMNKILFIYTIYFLNILLKIKEIEKLKI